MFNKLFDWLNDRTGFRKLRDAMILEDIPGGAKWRYVWGSALAFVFFLQLITGILLMTAYSPGSNSAWGSVYYIQYNMDFGWLIRGLHHYGSQTMVVLLGLHMLQVVIAGAHLPPREVNWWLGLGLLGIVLGLSLTGYLLPWDEKGYWASQVATNIMSEVPLIGPFLQKVVVGGADYGNQTLTHFYALHVGVLPLLLIVLLIAHIAVFRRHGVTAPKNAEGHEMFWPKQAFRDLVVSLVVFGIMLGLVLFAGHGNAIETENAEEQGWYEQIAKAGRNGVGANLDAPADRETDQYPARPEWYFLFLFQLLKYFQGDQVIVGTIIIPGAVGLLLFILPLLGIGKMRKFGHFFGILVVVALLAGVGVLTVLAMQDDANDENFQKRVKVAEKSAGRAVQLASDGIPVAGGHMLLRRDPKTRGRKLFETNCASCHSYTTQKGDDVEGFTEKTMKNPKFTPKFTASDLGDFGSYEWIYGLLKNPSHNKYFGRTGLTGMTKWRAKIDKEDDPKKKALIEKELVDVAKFLVESQKPNKYRDKAIYERGKKAFFNRKGANCRSCHAYDGSGGESAPDLTGYGTQEWMRFMIMSPSGLKRHSAVNEMPAFRPVDGPTAQALLAEYKSSFSVAKSIVPLSNVDRELIIRFIARDYRVVFGGEVIAGPKKEK